jgi:hypothetical protein
MLQTHVIPINPQLNLLIYVELLSEYVEQNWQKKKKRNTIQYGRQ